MLPPHRPGGDLVLNDRLGTLADADADGDAIGMGFHVVSPSSADAYYIEKMAWRYRLLLPHDLRPERAPNRKG